jgi:hypothetical protein
MTRLPCWPLAAVATALWAASRNVESSVELELAAGGGYSIRRPR